MVLALITQNISTTLCKLEAQWSLIGLDEDSRESERVAFLNEITKLCDSKLLESEATLNSFYDQIEELKSTTAGIYAEISEDNEYEELPTKMDQISLKQNLALHKKALEVAEGRRNTRMREMTNLYERLRFEMLQLHDQLTEEDLAFLGSCAHLDLTKARMQKFASRIEALVQLKNSRAQSIHQSILRVQKLWSEMSMSHSEACVEEFDDEVWTGGNLGVKESVVTNLRSLEARLEAEKARRENIFVDQWEKLKRLWSLLSISETERKQFLESHEGLSTAIIEASHNEIERLTELKKRKLGDLIVEAREKLTTIYDEMRLTEEERAKFSYYTTVVLNEDTLQHCRAEIEVLEVKLATMQPILKLISKREKLLREAAELEAASHDSDRLLSRAKRDPGRLLREEKIRNMVAKELPKMEENLRTSISEWESKHGALFNVDGKHFLSAMEEEIEKSKSGREEERHRRAKTPSVLQSEIVKNGNEHSIPEKTPQKTPRKQITSASSRGATPVLSAKKPLHPSNNNNVVSISRAE